MGPQADGGPKVDNFKGNCVSPVTAAMVATIARGQALLAVCTDAVAQRMRSAACVVTLVDRLIHRSEIVQLDGESYRLREAKEQAAKRSTACSPRSAKFRASSMGDIPPPKASPI